MQPDQEPPRLGHGGRQSPGLLTRILAVTVGLLILIGAVAVSFVLFVIALTVLLAFGAYVWWKTRHLRRQLRTTAPPNGNVIEGQVNWSRTVDETESKKDPR